MNSNTFLIFISILGILSSCKVNNSRSKDAIAMNAKYVEEFNNDLLKDSLTRKIITLGDTTSYNRLYEIYNLSGNEKEWCYYAYIMANDFDYGEAYLDLYYILYIDSKDGSKTNKLANYYLLKAHEKGIKSADSEIKERFDKNLPIPTSKAYLKEI